MRQPPTTIERAYELARSGQFQGWIDIARKLTAEGHAQVDRHLGGPSIRADLKRLCAEAKAERRLGPVAG